MELKKEEPIQKNQKIEESEKSDDEAPPNFELLL